MTEQLDWRRVEDLLADRIAAAIFLRMDDGLADVAKKIERQIVDKTAYRLAERYASRQERESASQTITQQVVERAAELVIKLQKENAREEERFRMVRAIRNPIVPHLLEELRSLASFEASGKIKGSKVPILNNAFKEFGSYAAILNEVESADSRPLVMIATRSGGAETVQVLTGTSK